MKSTQLLAPLLLSSLILSGCGSAPATQAPGAASEVVTFADAPAGCVKSSKLTAKTSDLAQTTFTSVSNWFNITKANPGDGQLVFGTFDIPKDNVWNDHAYSASDARVVVYLTDTLTKRVGVGNFSGADDAKYKVKEVDVSSKNLSGGVFDKNGQLEISHLDSKYVCGTMKFNDGTNSLSGDFIAQVNAQ